MLGKYQAPALAARSSRASSPVGGGERREKGAETQPQPHSAHPHLVGNSVLADTKAGVIPAPCAAILKDRKPAETDGPQTVGIGRQVQGSESALLPCGKLTRLPFSPTRPGGIRPSTIPKKPNAFSHTERCQDLPGWTVTRRLQLLLSHQTRVSPIHPVQVPQENKHTQAPRGPETPGNTGAPGAQSWQTLSAGRGGPQTPSSGPDGPSGWPAA